MILKELDHYKDHLKSIESTKQQALRELQMANQAIQELTNKLEALSESKQEAIKAAESGKSRAVELEKKKSQQPEFTSDAWKADIDAERKLYKVSSSELNSIKQELTNLRQDLDVALEAKLAAFQEAERAEQAAQVNQVTKSQLSEEVSKLKNRLEQVNFDSLRAEEEHIQLLTEKEVHLLVHLSAKEAADKEIQRLREECGEENDLQKKLEEATEAIKVLQEQLNNVRDSDRHSLQAAVFEVQQAKKERQEATAEEALIRSSLDSLNLQVEEARQKLLKTNKVVVYAEERIKQLQAEIETSKAELDSATSSDVLKDMASQLEKLITESERDKHQADEIMKEIELVRKEADAAIAMSKEADQKLEAALKDVEEAKSASKKANDQIYNSPRTNAANIKHPESERQIKLTDKEFVSINHKIEKCQMEADEKVEMLMAQLRSISASENAIQQKVEGLSEECEQLKLEIEDAVKQVEMTEASKSIVEDELRKWREMEESNVGQPSSISAQLKT